MDSESIIRKVLSGLVQTDGGGVKETIQQFERIFGKGDWGKR